MSRSNMKLNFILGISVLLISSQFAGCNSTETEAGSGTKTSGEQNMSKESAKTPNVKVSKPDISKELLKSELMLQGTIKYLPMEGGFYGIIAKDGKKLLPMNLKAEYKQDGAVIKFSGKPIKDIVTIQQWGTPFKVSEIVIIKPGSKTNSVDM